ncbi:MAG: riboflavin synthase [Pyrinomonadaceae bacterium]|nr:riboflavin synthase [Pyrinomonadaceae bacterium]MCX7639191.1 riboflavin synthase [Pyrinomonadaceae bacterium]MDW8303588.1 riboflavin synthase [Acidobacteriota bacterium]
MFTGIIEEIGTIEDINKQASTAKLRISCQLVSEGTKEGDSISVSGVCLTAIDVSPTGFSADISEETLRKTTLGRLRQGSKVNLERSLTLQTRLGGHIILGHVDGCGEIILIERNGDYSKIRIAYPKELSHYMVYKGSIAVEGISLTIANLTGEWFEVAIIPKTWNQTNLSSLKVGDNVNLEVDILAKYVEKLLNRKNSAFTFDLD